MEWRIGEIFKYKGEWYQCLKSASCDECAFVNSNCIDYPSFKCSVDERTDNWSVIFKKLEKVGEVYEKRVSDGTFSTFQRYKVYNSVILPQKPYMYCNFIDSTIEIEIKQNKEDMGENNDIQPCSELYSEFPKGTASNTRHLVQEKKSVIEKFKEYLTQRSEEQLEKDFELIKRFNKSGVSVDDFLKFQESVQMKPFNLEAAKAGKSVCTRDGRNARIIAFDAKGEHPIIALVTDGVQESPYNYTKAGYYYDESVETMADLMMLSEKKEGWVNVYKGIDGITFSKYPYQSKEEAIKSAGIMSNRIDTVKICWEE